MRKEGVECWGISCANAAEYAAQDRPVKLGHNSASAFASLGIHVLLSIMRSFSYCASYSIRAYQMVRNTSILAVISKPIVHFKVMPMPKLMPTSNIWWTAYPKIIILCNGFFPSPDGRQMHCCRALNGFFPSSDGRQMHCCRALLVDTIVLFCRLAFSASHCITFFVNCITYTMQLMVSLLLAVERVEHQVWQQAHWSVRTIREIFQVNYLRFSLLHCKCIPPWGLWMNYRYIISSWGWYIFSW